MCIPGYLEAARSEYLTMNTGKPNETTNPVVSDSTNADVFTASIVR